MAGILPSFTIRNGRIRVVTAHTAKRPWRKFYEEEYGSR